MGEAVIAPPFKIKRGSVRPANGGGGGVFFDTTLGRPVYWDGLADWVDPTIPLPVPSFAAHDWITASLNTSTFTEISPTSASFLSDGSAGTSVFKQIDVIPGFKYRMTFQLRGSGVQGLVRIGDSASSPNYFALLVPLSVTQQSVDFVPTVTPIFISFGYSSNGALVEVSELAISQLSFGNAIAALGDSLTASSGSTGGNTYPAVAAAAFVPPRIVLNLGDPGQTSTQIAARFGGVIPLVTLPSNQIAATGATTLTAISTDFIDSGAVIHCSIQGISGTLARSGGTYTFTRDRNGSVVTAYPLTKMIVDQAQTLRYLTLWSWLGRNDRITRVRQMRIRRD